MTTLKEIRANFPMYEDIPDDQFAKAFHAKHYADMDFKDFSKRIGYMKGADPSEHDPASQEWREKYGAQSGSTLENLRAGIGKGMSDIMRGLGQLMPQSTPELQITGDTMDGVHPMVSREQVAESRQRDQDLMSTGAGKTGNVTGMIAAGLPAALIPGANTYLGASMIGGGMGLAAPSTSTKETLTNTALGGVLSPAAMLAGRGVVGAVKGAKAALWDPLTQAGQQRIAERAFQGFAGGADEAATAAQNIRAGMKDVLPGVQPTTAELAGNAGLAQLERTLKNNPEFTQAFASRAGGNRNAIMSAVDNIAGDDLGRQAAVNARGAAAKPLYEAADQAVVQADDTLKALLKRPSLGKAWEKAASIAAENGDEITQDALSGKTLHYLKTAMDDLSDWAPGSAIGKSEAGAIGKTRDALVSWMDTNVPSYGAAREAFKAGSKPINQMDVGKALREKLFPAMTDFGAETRLRPESFAQAMRHGDATAANVLGRSQASITDILSPDQMKSLTQVGQQLGRRVNADELGRAVGSNTGQNLVGQNAMRQLLGPLGMPGNWVEKLASGPLAQGVIGAPSKVASAATGTIGEPNILRKLVEIGLSPEEALKVLEAQIHAGPALLGPQRYIAPVVSGANSARQ
jgi:hypothetical protein